MGGDLVGHGGEADEVSAFGDNAFPGEDTIEGLDESPGALAQLDGAADEGFAGSLDEYYGLAAVVDEGGFRDDGRRRP
jgi:hypothetical protein